MYPNSVVYHLSAFYSDHVPILIVTAPEVGLPVKNKRWVRPFRFEARWVIKDDCQQVISENWTLNIRNPMDRFTANGSRTLAALTHWEKSSFGNILAKIRSVKGKLLAVQGLANTDPELEGTLKHELDHLLELEEIHWKQRLRVQWLSNEDRNTRYFHTKAN